jgi:zinc/manganese transport system permease protein
VFGGFMTNTWIVATIVAVVAGLVGFFVILRGEAFAAHAIPNGSFAGAAGAVLLNVNVLVGLGTFSLLGALGIGVLGRGRRRDVVTAMTLVTMLALGALFVSFMAQSAPTAYSLLFGEVLGVASNQLLPTAGLALGTVGLLALLYRPLLLSSVLADLGEARGIPAARIELAFLACVALATTMTVPVVGTTLVFSLMIGAPAAARALAGAPARALALSVAIALVTVWSAIAAAYELNLPVGFFVGVLSAASYALGRAWAAWRRGGGIGRSARLSSSAGGPDNRARATAFGHP